MAEAAGRVRCGQAMFETAMELSIRTGGENARLDRWRKYRIRTAEKEAPSKTRACWLGGNDPATSDYSTGKGSAPKSVIASDA